MYGIGCEFLLTIITRKYYQLNDRASIGERILYRENMTVLSIYQTIKNFSMIEKNLTLNRYLRNLDLYAFNDVSNKAK